MPSTDEPATADTDRASAYGLALPGVLGSVQLALDGREEAPAPRAAPESPAPQGPRDESLLGPLHGVSDGPGRVGSVQLELDLADTSAYPQLDLWSRLDQAAALADWDTRKAKCHRTRRKALSPVPIYRTERGGYKAGNLVRCGQWACPACGVERARKVSAKLGLAIERHRRSGDRFFRPDVWMLTLTMPHARQDHPGAVLDGLFASWDVFTHTAEWRTFRKRWGIASVVRVLDVTFGGRNGCHPHFHVALFPSNAATHEFDDGMMVTRSFRGMNDAARKEALAELGDELRPTWAAALRSVGVTRAIADESLDLAGGERAAAYFVGWGLADEVGATPVKQRSHLRLLDAAAAGAAAAGAAYTEFCAAVAGRQWVSSGLGDLCRRLGIDADALDEYRKREQKKRDDAAAARGEPVLLVAPFTVEIPAYLYPDALRLGWRVIIDTCEEAAAAGADVGAALVDRVMAAIAARRARGRPVREPDKALS